MSNKVIYIKDNFNIIDSINDLTNNLEVNDDLNISNIESKIDNCFIIMSDDINLFEVNQVSNSELIINDSLTIVCNFYVENSYLLLNDQINIDDYNNNQDVLKYSINDALYFSESWCNSNTVINNIISFNNVNFIVVNDIVYNTTNIQFYKFTIDDKFNFFIGNKYENKFSSYPIIDDESIITKINCFIYSDINGLLINNNIFLSEGLHNLKYKFKNTACQLNLKIIVNNKYFLIDNILYSYNENDLYKSKLIRNHIIRNEIVELNNDNLILSI